METVNSPYQPFAAERGLASPDGQYGRVGVVFGGTTATPPLAEVKQLVADVEALNGDGMTIGVGGQAVEFASTEPPKSEGVGILVAIVIMLIMFGAVVAAGRPILTALIGLGAGLALVTVAARFMDIATFGPPLAAMIGLGVGIDYALFVINRYRQAVNVGREPREAALESVNTAGRAVVFAGTTVVIALGGLFVLGISFMNGLAVGAAITVVMVMLTAVTLLPAVISLLVLRCIATGASVGVHSADPRRWAPLCRLVDDPGVLALHPAHHEGSTGLVDVDLVDETGADDPILRIGLQRSSTARTWARLEASGADDTQITLSTRGAGIPLTGVAAAAELALIDALEDLA